MLILSLIASLAAAQVPVPPIGPAAEVRPPASVAARPEHNPDAPRYDPALWNDGNEEKVTRFYQSHQDQLGKVSEVEGRLYPWNLAKVLYFRKDEDFSARYGMSVPEAREFRLAFDEATKGVQYRTNCYAYAVNSPHGHPPGWKPYPGHKAGLGLGGKADFTEDGLEMIRRAAADGLVPGGTQPAARKGYYLVALFIIPGDDYHFLRQDEDGTWSGKAGEDPVSNLDFADKPITDPRTAFFRDYRFVSFLYVPKGGLNVNPPPAPR